MIRSKIIIIGAALLFLILLFQLPKVIIKNDRELKTETIKTNDSISSPETASNHTTTIPDPERKILEQLKKNYLILSDKEKKLKFADSISEYYRTFHKYDSSALYLEEKNKLQPVASNFEKTGDAYNEAVNFASDNEKPAFNSKAKENYQKALNLNPGNLDLKSKLAMTYVGGESTMEGVVLLREVLKEDPKNELAMYNLGILSIQSQQYEKAIKRFKDLLEINPAHASAYFYLGMSYMNTGKKNKAKEAFQKAKSLEKDPGFQAAADSYLNDLK